MESRVPGVALLLALAVVLCSAQEPWTQTLNFDKGDDVFVHAAFHNVPVLQDGVTFAIEASDDSCKFVVCYSFLIRAPNDLTEWPVRSPSLKLIACCCTAVSPRFCVAVRVRCLLIDMIVAEDVRDVGGLE